MSSLEQETTRLRAHFERALRTLHADVPRGLSPLERRARAKIVDDLSLYRERAVFPKNRGFAGRRMPYFIDEDGTRCGVAHLLEKNGGRDVMDHIRRTRNNQYVPAMLAVAELGQWAMRHGLTSAELEIIQPDYCYQPFDCICDTPLKGALVVGTVIGPVEDDFYTLVSVEVQEVLRRSPNRDGGPTPEIGEILNVETYSEPITGSRMLVRTLKRSVEIEEFPFASDDVLPLESNHVLDTTKCRNLHSLAPLELPLATYLSAKSARDVASCRLVLTTEDAAWGSPEEHLGDGYPDEECTLGEEPGNEPQTRSDGCEVAMLADGSVPLGLALCAASVAARRAVARRRR